MSALLSADEYIKHLESQGNKVISCIHAGNVRSALAKGDNNSAPLPDPEIKDGIYNIVQFSTGGSSISASIPFFSPSAPTGDLPVTMTPPSIGNTRQWRLIAAYGSRDGFFIVPSYTPGVVTDLGGTTLDVNGAVKVRRNDCYPVWRLRCDMRLTYRQEKADGTYEEKYYYRILKIGTTQCWTTSTKFDVNIKNVNDDTRFDQLFELVLVPITQDYVIQSTQPIQVSANNAQLQRKLWFASGQLSADQLARMVSVQIATTARDQGWASNPNQGIWTWFEVCVLKGPVSSDEFTEKDIKSDNGKLLSYFSHSTELSNEFRDQTGKLFDRDAELWQHVEADNLIGFLACAQFPLWRLEGRAAKMNFVQLTQ